MWSKCCSTVNPTPHTLHPTPKPRTAEISQEELLQAKALLDAQKSAAETRMPPSIPLEIDPFKPGPGSDKADGKGFGKKD